MRSFDQKRAKKPMMPPTTAAKPPASDRAALPGGKLGVMLAEVPAAASAVVVGWSGFSYCVIVLRCPFGKVVVLNTALVTAPPPGVYVMTTALPLASVVEMTAPGLTLVSVMAIP